MNLLQKLRFAITGKIDAAALDRLPGAAESGIAVFQRPAEMLDVDRTLATGEIKSVTIGDIIPIGASGRPVLTEWTEQSAIKDGLKVSTWVYACIYRIAKAVASVPMRAERKIGDQWVAIDGTSLLADLWSKPNPYWSRADLTERWIFHLLLTGNGLITKVRANGLTRELWTISPDLIKPLPDRMEVLLGYRFSPPGQAAEFVDPGDVIHVMLTDPNNPYWGLSPLQVGARTVDSDVTAADWGLKSLRNQAVPSGVLTFGKPLSNEQYESAKERIRSQYTGSSNARGVMVLGNEAKWQSISMSPAEMDFLNSRKMNREEICAIFNVPPPLVGIYDHATLANIETSRRIFWEETIIPLVGSLMAAVNRGLAPEYGADIRLAPDYTKIPALRELIVAMADTAQKYWAMGVPFNAINERFGLGFPESPAGDISWVPSSVVPADTMIVDAAHADEGLPLPAPPAAPKPGKVPNDQTTEDPMAKANVILDRLSNVVELAARKG